MENLGMYCLCYIGSEPKRQQHNQKNIMCGSINYDSADILDMQNRGFLMDHTGDNISHLNSNFGSLTGIYWVWKNTQHEYKGTNTYRLFWNESIELKPNRIYVPQPIDVTTAVIGQLPNPDIITHFNYCHDPNGLSWQLLRNLADRKQIGITASMIDALAYHRYLIPYHMFTCDSNNFDKLCKILFEILFEFNSRCVNIISELYSHTGQIRFYDFFSERIFHIVLANIYYFFGNVDVRHLNLCTLAHKS